MVLDLLLTDKCFLLMLIIVILMIINAMRKTHVRASVRQIFKKPIAASSSVILLCFLTIGVLDSIHLKSTTTKKTSSLLDNILSPLDTHYEKTYSAPFALNLYTSKTVMEGEHATQIYPRLLYPPQNLTKSKLGFLFVKAMVYSILVAILAFFVVSATYYIVKKRRLKTHRYQISKAQFAGLFTVLICVFSMFLAYYLSRYVHILGTGKIGQDIFYYTVKSIRTGLIIGTLTTFFMMPLALVFGIAAGYYGGVIDDVIQYIYTTLSSIPGVLLITASVLSMQTYIANHPEQFSTLAASADARLLALCIILGITSWTSLCRLLRAEALKLREVDFVLAAQSLGSRSWTILSKHLLPNVMHIVLITLVLDFSFLVLAEAVLSYVGVGVSPLTISWGNMINAARLELAREPIVWWPVFSAFILMFILVLSSNLFADAVRDAFDPRHSD